MLEKEVISYLPKMVQWLLVIFRVGIGIEADLLIAMLLFVRFYTISKRFKAKVARVTFFVLKNHLNLH